MTRKNLQHLKVKSELEKKTTKTSTFLTAEDIEIKSTYSKEDVEGLPHLNFVAGLPPYLRGIYSTMYVRKPWTINQCNVPLKNNTFDNKSQAEQKGVSAAFSVTSQQNYNPKQNHTIVDLGASAKTINTVEDMEKLFNKIPLNKATVSITANNEILPLLALYIVTAEKQGIKTQQLKGIIKHDILKAFMVGHPHVFPPKASIKVISNILEYTNKHMPKFNSISISSNHIQEAGATADITLAYALASGVEYIRTGLAAGLNIDRIASQISFSFNVEMHHFMEISKIRAARMLWAKLVKRFNPKNQKSLALKTHCQTSNSSLAEHNPFNNITRTTIKAFAAAFAGTQSLHINTIDKALGLSVRNAKNIQFFLQEETDITRTIDPWAGSYYLEKLTHDIAKKAWDLFEEIETLGGITQTIEKGIPQAKIKIAATKKQTIESTREDIIIDSNNNKLKGKTTITESIVIDKPVKKSNQLNTLKTDRDIQKTENSLLKLTEAAKYAPHLNAVNPQNNKNLNLLNLAIEAARNHATAHEISKALNTAFGKE